MQSGFQIQGTRSGNLQLIKDLSGDETIFVDDLAGGKSGHTNSRYLREYVLKPIQVLFGFGDVSVRAIASLQARQWIESIVISVVEPFNPQATLTLGILNRPETLVGSSKIDLLEPGDYQFFINQQFVIDTDIYAYLNLVGSVTGSGFIYFYLR